MKIESDDLKEIENLESANKIKDKEMLDLKSQLNTNIDIINEAKDQVIKLTNLVEKLKQSNKISEDKAELFKAKLNQKLEEINTLKNHIKKLEHELNQRQIVPAPYTKSELENKNITQTNISVVTVNVKILLLLGYANKNLFYISILKNLLNRKTLKEMKKLQFIFKVSKI